MVISRVERHVLVDAEAQAGGDVVAPDGRGLYVGEGGAVRDGVLGMVVPQPQGDPGGCLELAARQDGCTLQRVPYWASQSRCLPK